MRLCGCGSAPHMSLVQGGSDTILALFFANTPFPTMTTPIIAFTYSATAQGIFDCFTSTFPCMDRWDLIPTRSSPYLVHFTRFMDSLDLPSASTSATIHTTTEGIEPSSLTRQASALHV